MPRREEKEEVVTLVVVEEGGGGVLSQEWGSDCGLGSVGSPQRPGENGIQKVG